LIDVDEREAIQETQLSTIAASCRGHPKPELPGDRRAQTPLKASTSLLANADRFCRNGATPPPITSHEDESECFSIAGDRRPARGQA